MVYQSSSRWGMVCMLQGKIEGECFVVGGIAVCLLLVLSNSKMSILKMNFYVLVKVDQLWQTLTKIVVDLVI